MGHPVLEGADEVEEDEAFRQRWALATDRPILALLPGSRPQEIHRHLDLFVRVGEDVRALHPDLVPVIARARGLPASRFDGLPFPVVDDARGLLRHARAALVKSGTATLEAAIADTPMVVAYRTSRLTWSVAKRLVRTDIALPNLVAGAPIVPEFVQGAATVRALTRALLPLLRDGPGRAAQLDGFGRIRSALGRERTSERVAALALDLMDGSA